MIYSIKFRNMETLKVYQHFTVIKHLYSHVFQLLISKGESNDPGQLRITTELEPGKDHKW